MMNIWEWVVILLVALVVIKPERLPEMAYLLGKCIMHCRMWYQQIVGKYNQLL